MRYDDGPLLEQCWEEQETTVESVKAPETSQSDYSCAVTEGRRLVYVIDSLRTGGTERHLMRLVQGLATSGWHVSVYCLAHTGRFVSELEEIGVQVEGPARSWSKTASSILYTTKHLCAYLQRERPAVVHCYLPTSAVIGTVACRIAGVPVVVTTRRTVHNRRGRRLLVYRLATTVTDRLSSAIVAVCDAAREQAIREGTPETRIVTIYNAAPRFRSRHIRRDLFAGSPVFGTIGRLHPSKGYIFLIEAVPLVLEKLPQARFVLVGEGGERVRLEKRARELGVASRVDFLGERVDADDLLPEFDIFVSPSVVEGMPNAILEAAVARIPIVATGVGGVPEVIQDALTGLLVEPGSSSRLASALIRMGQDEMLRTGCVRKAEELVSSRFREREEIARTEGLYLGLLSEECIGGADGGELE